jgi:hypothetical protein
MGFQIEDGKGSGRTAEVDGNNHLVVNSISQSIEHFANHVKKKAYNLRVAVTPTGPDDCFCYFKNSGEIDITVEGIRVWLVANEYIDVKIGDTGTPVGGTDITPINLHTGSSNAPTGTFQQGVNITTLTGGSVAERIYHASSQGSTNYNFDQDIIISKNGVMTLYAGTGTTALSITIMFNEHEPQHTG